MRRIPRFILWVALLVVSIAIHSLSARKIGHEIKQADEALAKQMEMVKGRQIVVEVPAQLPKPTPAEEEQKNRDEPLQFESDFELEPPEVLIAPQAVAPPPPDVALSLKAQAGGAGDETQPVQIAVATPGTAGLIQRASIPTVGTLGPMTSGGTGGGSGGGTAGFGVGIGNALGGSSNQFAAYLAGMRESGLDVVFVIDATGTMGWVLEEVKHRVEELVTVVRALVPLARFGVVAYKDYDAADWVTRNQPLTYSTLRIQDFARGLEAVGGGDMYEAVGAGIHAAIEGSDWRPGARKVIILIADYPPEGSKVDGIVHEVRRFAAKGGVVSTLDVSDQSNPAALEAKVGRKVDRGMYRNDSMVDFRIIADAGGGDASTLEGEISVTRRLIILIMGGKFAKEMGDLLELI